MSEWFYRRGSLASGPWQTVVGERPGWQHTGLRVAELTDGPAGTSALGLPADGFERIVVPIAGACTVEYTEPDGAHAVVSLAGRPSVFDGATDVLYLGVGTTAVLTGTGTGTSTVAVAEARAERALPARHVTADEVPVEVRGAGTATREVRNFGIPGVLEADRLIACEVITPSGNWSSYPPHKHDEDVPGVESRLEEIYWFDARPDPAMPGGDDPFGFFATYSSSAGEIDVAAMARPGDVALVPYGYHGPAAAPPGYDLYYLNVMAGPGAERAWRITDDPRHAGVREAWQRQAADPRLPLGTHHPEG
ncbi:5-deoxy-glucuronate isomerase [Isoptericola croceus]|uniref:5-deoxy-glucuronate isomerase n=1 Tax=Isoptericola croceus TaxID=3031406 RepID=UPI0023F66116|nr:5-deoxy-glucuronate isomerase [Isoptericola croceus]